MNTRRRGPVIALAAVLLAVLSLLTWFVFANDGRAPANASSNAPTLRDHATLESAAGPEPTSTPTSPSTDLALEAPAMPATTLVESPVESAVDAPVEARASARFSSITLYGVVRPDPTRPRFESPPYISVCNAMGERATTTCAKDGAYSIPGLAPGEHWVTATASMNGSVSTTVELLGDVESQRLDLALELPAQLLVKVVTRDGSPLAPNAPLDLLAAATLEAPGPWLEAARGSGNLESTVSQFWRNDTLGRELPAEHLGRLELRHAPPLWVSLVHFQRVVATQRVEAGAEEVEFVIDAGSALLATASLRGRVVDALTKTPIASATAQTSSGGSSKFGSAASQGVFEFDELPPGVTLLRVRARGMGLWETRLRLEPGEVRELGDIELEPERKIVGLLRTDPGGPTAGKVRYAAIDARSGDARTPQLRTFVTADKSGAFAVAGLSSGVYRLIVDDAESEHGVTTRVVDVRGGSVEGVVLSLRRGTPLLVRASDERWRDVRFTIHDSEGERLVDAPLYGPEPRRIRLAPGRYELACFVGADAAPLRRTLEIASEPVLVALP